MTNTEFFSIIINNWWASTFSILFIFLITRLIGGGMFLLFGGHWSIEGYKDNSIWFLPYWLCRGVVIAWAVLNVVYFSINTVVWFFNLF